ncbi:MAG: alpha/beta fold hydrolase [Solirubrobacteraceae bacterium]
MDPERSRRLIVRGACLGTLLAAGAGVQWRHAERIAQDPAYKLLHSPPSGRPLEVDSADGTVLHAEWFGPEHGPTIVLAHGWTETLWYWTYVIYELLEREFRVVAYDLRGHGDSGLAATGDYALERLGEDVEAVLRACVPDGEQATLVGHSLGAMSIAAWAKRFDVDSRVGAAALLNTGFGDLLAKQLVLTLPAFAHALIEPLGRHLFLGASAPLPHFSSPILHAVIRHLAFGRHATPGQVAFYEPMLLTCAPEVRAACGIAMCDMDLYEALERLTVPTLVIAGASDRLTPPSHARRIAESLPNLTGLIEVPGMGHMGPLERGAELAAELAILARRASEREGDSTVAAEVASTSLAPSAVVA